MKKTIIYILRFLAQYKLKRTRPRIIGVTGSYGKTTLKEVLAAVLAARYRVLKSEKSLNTDIGMCLAILEQPSGFNNPLKWLGILVRATWNALVSKPYDFFVLEYGVDKPGDMDYLLSIAKPDCAIITAIAQVHQAAGQFNSLKEVAEEKGKLAYSVKSNGHVILNHAATPLHRIGTSVHAKMEYYNNDHVHATHVEQKIDGISGTAHIAKTTHTFRMTVVGTYHADCALVAFMVAELYGVTPKEVQDVLAHFVLPPGRMSLISGKHGATIIDSTYNASPETVVNALHILKNFPAKRRIAVLGTMNELGGFFEAGHTRVASECDAKIDVLVGVGEGGDYITKKCLQQATKPAIVQSFERAHDAVTYLTHTLKLAEGDVILLKGSQNRVRLERAVKELMLHPEQAEKLLCRQEKEWQKRL